MNTYTALDLFCGAGGVSEALKQEFNIVGAVEFDPIIAKSYMLNHGDKHLIQKDIKSISETEWKETIALKPQQLDLLVATPPCQGFSSHSRKSAIMNNDQRNDLVLEVLKAVNIFEPKFILFENVPNIINYKVFHKFIRNLSNIKKDGFKRNPDKPAYHVQFKIIDASNYGVPQKRKRLILIGRRIDILPNKEAFIRFPSGSTPYVIKPLDIWPVEETAPSLGKYLANFKLNSLKAGEQDSADSLHVALKLFDINLKRIKATPKNGGSRDVWPDELVLECHKKKKVSFSDVYGRMNFNDYAPTITTGCINYSRGRFGHPIEDRAISLREAALIQTFPIEYKFVGSIASEINEGAKGNIAIQIGNAVPVNLARTFIKLIKNTLDLNH
ncbi:TPA: DNA cytosine methyltransferase [Bacillus pseudomycoides]|nr:DNA cytosine methyltransferase [Bacillus pseudomycoides]